MTLMSMLGCPKGAVSFESLAVSVVARQFNEHLPLFNVGDSSRTWFSMEPFTALEVTSFLSLVVPSVSTRPLLSMRFVSLSCCDLRSSSVVRGEGILGGVSLSPSALCGGGNLRPRVCPDN